LALICNVRTLSPDCPSREPLPRIPHRRRRSYFDDVRLINGFSRVSRPENRLLDFVSLARLSPFVSQESDRKAFADLMNTYAGPMRRLCAAYANGADREDLFQNIFLAVWRALPAFRGDSSPRTWLYRIAHNVALTWQRRDRRRQSRETALNEDVQPSAQMDLRTLALSQAIAAMSPGDRTLTLLWLEGLSAAEIEDVTGVKSATVAVRLSRIRKQLSPVEVTV